MQFFFRFLEYLILFLFTNSGVVLDEDFYLWLLRFAIPFAKMLLIFHPQNRLPAGMFYLSIMGVLNFNSCFDTILRLFTQRSTKG